MRTREFQSNHLQRRAFTMVEIMTAVAITTLIVFALVSMFNTSTKALLMGIKQKDVWVSARAAFGMMTGDVEKLTEGGRAVVGGNSELRISAVSIGPTDPSSCFTLPNSREICNQLQDFYLLSKNGSSWAVDIYRVIRETPDIGVGTLYRYHQDYTTFDLGNGENLPIDFSPLEPGISADLDENNPFTWPDSKFVDRSSRMVDGVVHMRMVAYDTDGRELANPLDFNPPLQPNSAGEFEYAVTENGFWFSGDLLPASVDLELFVIEPDRINEFRAQSGDIAKRNYLQDHIGNVQMFLTRIPIRKDVPELQ